VTTPSLKAFVSARAENRPGVYRFYGPGRELLYVGKSVRLRSRLLSYFRAPRGEKAWELVQESSAVEWEDIPNEFAALVREMKLIQRWQPRFNVEHRRRKIYAFVKVTRERAPRMLSVSKVVDDGATYYGPFPRVGALRSTVRELGKVLGLRDCPAQTQVFFSDQLEIFRAARPPRCMRADLRTCLAPCCGRPSAVEYRDAVTLARRFLEGRAHRPLRELEERMAGAASRMEFEYAAVLRDRLERLKSFQADLTAFRGQVEDLSFVYRVSGFAGDDRIYLIRRGRILDDLPYPRGRRARERTKAALEAVYSGPDHPPSALAAEEAAEILLVARWFRRNPQELKRTARPQDWKTP